MAKDTLTVTVINRWWHRPVYFLMKVAAVLGWEFTEKQVEWFVENSTRLELR